MDTKVCTKCGEVKALSEFGKDRTTKTGLKYSCKACQKAYNAENAERSAMYRVENADKLAAQKKVYYAKNKEKIASEMKAYQAKNKEKRAAYSKTHYIDNAKKRIAQAKAYRKTSAKYDIFASQLDFVETCTNGPDGELLIPCTYCGKMHAPTVCAVNSRIAAINGKTKGECRLYCSEACKHACPSYQQHLHWKSSKPATSREVSYQFRQLVLARDNWTCQKCGKGVEAQLHVHHLSGATQQPFFSNDLENGITLCKACHKTVHAQDGCKYHELKCLAK